MSIMKKNQPNNRIYIYNLYIYNSTFLLALRQLLNGKDVLLVC